MRRAVNQIGLQASVQLCLLDVPSALLDLMRRFAA